MIRKRKISGIRVRRYGGRVLYYLILYPRPRGPFQFLRKILPFAKNAKNSCIFYVRFWKILRNFAFMNNTKITSYTPKAGNGRTTKRRSAIRVVIAIPHSPILLTIPSTFISGNDLQTISRNDTAARHTRSLSRLPQFPKGCGRSGGVSSCQRWS